MKCCGGQLHRACSLAMPDWRLAGMLPKIYAILSMRFHALKTSLVFFDMHQDGIHCDVCAASAGFETHGFFCSEARCYDVFFAIAALSCCRSCSFRRERTYSSLCTVERPELLHAGEQRSKPEANVCIRHRKARTYIIVNRQSRAM